MNIQIISKEGFRMNQKNQDRDSKQASRTADEICRIGRTTYLIRHRFTENRNLENVIERLILSDKSLL